MNPAYKIIMILITLSVLPECASHLDYIQGVPNASQFHPRVVAILPIKIPPNAQADVDMISDVIANGIAETKKFDRVIDPFTVLAQMGENKQLQDDIMAYLSKTQASGVSEKALSAKIAEVFHADTLLVIEIPRMYADTVTFSVVINVNMVDGASGTVIWKANHGWTWSRETKRSELKTIIKRLMKHILGYLPTS